MTDEQKIYYINTVCNICSNKKDCNKDKFISTEILNRLSIKCLEYKYEKI